MLTPLSPGNSMWSDVSGKHAIFSQWQNDVTPFVCVKRELERKVYFYIIHLCSPVGTGERADTSSRIKDKKWGHTKLAVRRWWIIGQLQMHLSTHFFSCPTPSPLAFPPLHLNVSSSVSEYNFKIALMGLTVGGRKMDDSHRLSSTFFLSIRLASKSQTLLLEQYFDGYVGGIWGQSFQETQYPKFLP